MEIDVICKKECRSIGDARFYKNEIYKAITHNNESYHIIDKDGNYMRLEENINSEHKFSRYFYTYKTLRKDKIKSINYVFNIK